MIFLYLLLTIMGLINIYRFCRLKGFTMSLTAIYFFSITEQIAISLWMGTTQLPSQYNYVQYSVYLFSKLCLGISYQLSVFELKFIIEHYFKGTPKEKYLKKRKMTRLIMWTWRFVIAVFLGCDIYFNYIRYFFDGISDSKVKLGFAYVSYTFTGI